MKKIQKKRKGFTLIELVVVIVIVAILAAVALLSFGSFTETARDSRVKSEHSQLITAGNMWRAAQDDPNWAPNTLVDITSYMETSKPLTDGAHSYNSETGELSSTLLKPVKDETGTETNTLKYDFGDVKP